MIAARRRRAGPTGAGLVGLGLTGAGLIGLGGCAAQPADAPAPADAGREAAGDEAAAEFRPSEAPAESFQWEAIRADVLDLEGTERAPFVGRQLAAGPRMALTWVSVRGVTEFEDFLPTALVVVEGRAALGLGQGAGRPLAVGDLLLLPARTKARLEASPEAPLRALVVRAGVVARAPEGAPVVLGLEQVLAAAAPRAGGGPARDDLLASLGGALLASALRLDGRTPLAALPEGDEVLVVLAGAAVMQAGAGRYTSLVGTAPATPDGAPPGPAPGPGQSLDGAMPTHQLRPGAVCFVPSGVPRSLKNTDPTGTIALRLLATGRPLPSPPRRPAAPPAASLPGGG